MPSHCVTAGTPFDGKQVETQPEEPREGAVQRGTVDELSVEPGGAVEPCAPQARLRLEACEVDVGVTSDDEEVVGHGHLVGGQGAVRTPPGSLRVAEAGVKPPRSGGVTCSAAIERRWLTTERRCSPAVTGAMLQRAAGAIVDHGATPLA
jgi:hypothetical protein